jgi:hypothetical protein
MKWTFLMTGMAGEAVRTRDIAPTAVTRPLASAARARDIALAAS